MLGGMAQQTPVPAQRLATLVEANQWLSHPPQLRKAFARDGYVLLRGVLPAAAVIEARREVFGRLAEMDEIEQPVELGLRTGRSRRNTNDLGPFWKSVSEGPALRSVSHGEALHELVGLLFDGPARAHDYLFLRPAPIGMATNLHYDYPFFAGGASRIVTAWTPLGEIPVEDGPLVLVEGSQDFQDLIDPIRKAALSADAQAFDNAQAAAYQAAAANMLDFAQRRNARLLTCHFQPGDTIIFSGFMMHGSLDNHSKQQRVRLSVDVRYQPAHESTDDPRYFGPDPKGAKGGGYGEQKAAQPLGTPWVKRQ